MTTPPESLAKEDDHAKQAVVVDPAAVRAQRRQDNLERFEGITALPLLVLAVAFIPLLILPLLFELSEPVEDAFLALDWLIWAAFAAEFIIRLTLSSKKWRFVRRNWADLLIVVVPFLRPLRILRSARALRLLRLTRLVALLNVASRQASRLLVKHRLHLVILVTAVVVLAGAAVGFAVEEGQGGKMDSFGDSLWWSVSTVTTVGYGDVYPVTPAGRGIAVLLMLAGVAFFSVLAGNIAAFFLERVPEKQAAETDHRLDEILRRLEGIESRLADRDSAAARSQPT
ncbi:MAG: potassium channel family protein [Acidimicrobiia bacterium]